jgi:hypothetical protein
MPIRRARASPPARAPPLRTHRWPRIRSAMNQVAFCNSCDASRAGPRLEPVRALPDRMTMAMQEPKKSPDAFQWNKGGWFGALFGGTCWLLIMAVMILGEDPLTGGAILLCYAVSILYGLSLWRRRAELRSYSSIQKLIVVEGLCALGAVASVHLRDAMQYLPEHSQVPIWMMYGALLIFPALLAKFHLQERAAGA